MFKKFVFNTKKQKKLKSNFFDYTIIQSDCQLKDTYKKVKKTYSRIEFKEEGGNKTKKLKIKKADLSRPIIINQYLEQCEFCNQDKVQKFLLQ